ncbi:MAG: DNA alkylation repair protein [Lachnospiraceae bacterium]|jgi:3-methyladenine DNA glycosylase AlkD|nr:DNA alkylation repair protein [Lachnospiraceae bacterium]
MIEEIREELFALQDLKYQEFQAKLIPSIEADSMIGVRTPELRKLAKKIGKSGDAEKFLKELPHTYFDENQLHAFILSGEKEFAKCIEELEAFLPYVDNWATCDQMSPKVFKKHRQELLPYIEKWLQADETYTVRFGIGMLMEHFLDEEYDERYPEMVASVRSEEYYVNMMIAWYFATALAKQYESIVPYIEKRRLEAWTHNKAIQKAVESYRITPEQKTYLKSLKVKNKS